MVAAQSASEEPDSPARNTLDSTLTWASPPRARPISAAAKANSRVLIPASFISVPASTNIGTASSGKECTPEATRWPTISSEMLLSQMT